MPDNEFDVVIIGGGPAGYVAAIRSAQIGFKTAVVEKDNLGGICLNWGCIPTKTLLRSSEIFHSLHELDAFGITVSNINFDIKKAVKRSRSVAQQLSAGVSHLMKKNKVKVIKGHAKILNNKSLIIENSDIEPLTISAQHIILATGAKARQLPHIQSNNKTIWTYKEAMVPETLPASVLIIGSGAIGMEFASFYSDVGTNVTVLEQLDRILPNEDEEISTFAADQFIQQNINLLTSSNIDSIDIEDSHVKATITDSSGNKSDHNFERIILAVGIEGNTENLGLENTDVRVDGGHIVTNTWSETDEKGIYAIGDVSGPPWLAHKASHEGILCIEKIAGLDNLHPIKKENIPSCTYCRPQIASVGVTEEQALKNGHNIRVGKFPFLANGKALALGETKGLVKTIFDKETGQLLGAHMIGAEVTELINGFIIGMTLETTEAELINSIFPHPTLSEMMHESVLNAYDKGLHI